MEKETVFADGFVLKAPHENAPDFVKGSLSVKVDEAIKFLEAHKDEKGWVNLDLKESKNGKWYVQKNDWKPKEKTESTDSEVGSDGIPF